MFSVAAATFGVRRLDAAFFPPRMQLPTAATKMIVTLRMDLA